MKTFLEMAEPRGAFDLHFHDDAVGPLVSTYTVVTGDDGNGRTMSFYMPVGGPVKAGEMWDIRYELAWESLTVNTIDYSEIRIGLNDLDERDGFAVVSPEGSFNVNPNTNRYGRVSRRGLYIWPSASADVFVKTFVQFASTGATGSQFVSVTAGSLKMLRYVPR